MHRLLHVSSILTIFCSTYKSDCTGQYTASDGSTQDRQWLTHFNNFDNVIWAMITFFELVTEEAWENTNLLIIDSQGYDMGPLTDNRPWASIFFVTFIFIQSFFVMNLFVSVIVDKFNEEIKRR